MLYFEIIEKSRGGMEVFKMVGFGGYAVEVYNVESYLGIAGRNPTATVDAFREMGWDSDSLEKMLEQWEKVVELPEVPGGYYVTRAIDQAYWNIVNSNENPTDMLIKWGEIVNNEIQRKRVQYYAE